MEKEIVSRAERFREDLIGREFETNSCGKCVVTEYVDISNVTVKFYDPEHSVKCHLTQLRKGNVKNPFHPRVYGVGFFGVGKYSSKEDSRAYDLWNKMLQRCYDHNSRIRYPTYKDVTVCDEWLNFQNFAEWCYSQEFFTYKDDKGKSYHLDKDILVKGNKIYSPYTCCFIPAYINTMLLGCDKARGRYPKGVCYHKGKGKIVAQLRSSLGGKVHLGGFDTVEDAFQAYKKAKESLIRETACKFKDVLDSRIYAALMSWEITDK